MDKKRTYGFVVERETASDGTEQVSARILAREDDALHPINCKHDGESAIWDAPKHLDGYMLAGLGMRGHVYDDCDGNSRLIGFTPDFHDCYSVDLASAKAMVKTLRRVEKAIQTESASEPGDVFMAVVRALRLDWYAIEGEYVGGWGYASKAWDFRPVEEGRNALRRMVEAAIAREPIKAKVA